MASPAWMAAGFIFANRTGLRWRDAPAAYGAHKALDNRWKRWSEAGVFMPLPEIGVRHPHRRRFLSRKRKGEGRPWALR